MNMDLFAHALSRNAAAEPLRDQALEWEEPGTSLWGRAWLDHVRHLFTPQYASELAFAEKLLRAGRLQSFHVRRGHIQAAFTNREGGTALVNLGVRRLSPEDWVRLERLCDRCGAALFTSDDLPDDAVADLFGQPGGLLPELKDLAFSCSHCHAPFCLYRAAALLAVTAEFDLKPIKLFELRGASRELMLTRAAHQISAEDERIADSELSAVFGIDLV